MVGPALLRRNWVWSREGTSATRPARTRRTNPVHPASVLSLTFQGCVPYRSLHPSVLAAEDRLPEVVLCHWRSARRSHRGRGCWSHRCLGSWLEGGHAVVVHEGDQSSPAHNDKRNREHSELWQMRDVDFVALAESMGVRGFRVERAAEFEPAMEQALATRGPALINVVTDIDALAPNGSARRAVS